MPCRTHGEDRILQNLNDRPERFRYENQHRTAAYHRVTLLQNEGEYNSLFNAEHNLLHQIAEGHINRDGQVEALCEELKALGGLDYISKSLEESERDGAAKRGVDKILHRMHHERLKELYAWAVKHEDNDNVNRN